MENFVAPPEVGAAPPAGVNAAIDKAFAVEGEVVQEPPSPYEDREKILAFFKEAKRECLEGRDIFVRLWQRNILYLLGRQWIYWDRKRGQWMDKRLARWIPKPVTNKIAEAHESLVSLFGSIALEVTARPIAMDSKSIATAEIVDKLIPCMHADQQMGAVQREADFWLVLTGNSFLFSYYDPSPQWGTVAVPFAKCQQCGEGMHPVEAKIGKPCAACGGTATVVQEQMAIGKVVTEALSPFEVAAPVTYNEFEDSPIVLRMQWRTKRQLEHMYGKAKIAEMEIQWQRSPTDRSLQVMKAIASQGDMTAATQAWLLGAGGESENDGITEYELWSKPNEDFPDGLIVRVLGEGDDMVMIDTPEWKLPGPLPYWTVQGEAIIPFVHTAFNPVGGRLFGGCPIDKGCSINDAINRIDSLTELIANRMANPVWLEPKGAEINAFTGEPGLVIKYNPLAAGGNAKPERIEGANIPATLFNLREQKIQDFEQMTGTFDVLKGAKPAGVEAFSALQLLVERGQARFTTVFGERGLAYQKWAANCLELERQFGPSKRTFAVQRPNQGWTVEHFMQADLQGAVELVIEDGTKAPKTNLGKRAAIEQAKNLGFIDPADTEQKYASLQELGLSSMMPSLDVHVKAAHMEQDAFEQWAAQPMNLAQFSAGVKAFVGELQAYAAEYQAAQAAPRPIDPMTGQAAPPAVGPMPEMPELTPLQAKEWHDGRVHIAEHVKWANSDTARALFEQAPQLEEAFRRHLELHDVLDAKRMLRQQMAQMKAQMELGMLMPGAGPGGPSAPPGQAGGGGQALDSSNRESGATSDVPAGNGPSGPQ